MPETWSRCAVCNRYEWCASQDSGGADKPAECDRDLDGRRKVAKRALGLPVLDDGTRA